MNCIITHSEDHTGRTTSRKRDHVELCVNEEVSFREKTTGLERYELTYNALPECDFDDVETRIDFLGKRCKLPIIVNSMTGGYEEAEAINRGLGEVCEEMRLGLGVGSQRQALESTQFHASWKAAREAGPTIPLFGNLGAAEIAEPGAEDFVQRLIDLVDADGFAVHLNPLQELLQPEGTPRFSGVLNGIERVAASSPVPIIVKEVGAGLSTGVVQRLVDVGVSVIDVSGAGGTSWAGVEILRNDQIAIESDFWDWGIPTSDAIIGARDICEEHSVKLVASGGVSSPRDAAVAIGLGAHACATARPILKRLREDGTNGVIAMMKAWELYLQSAMFLTGSTTIHELRHVAVRERSIA